MKTNQTLATLCLVAATSAGVCVPSAWAAESAENMSAQARFRKEMAVCNSGQSNQDVATCRIEAQHALGEARKGRLNDAPGQYLQNSQQRCGFLKGDDHLDCDARMRGEGTVQGTAQSGGMIRETTTTVIVK